MSLTNRGSERRIDDAFCVLVADPAWKLSDKLPGRSRGAEKNYRCLAVEKIVRFDLPPIADRAVLFLWRLASMPQEALDVVRFWGFKPKSEIVWRKLTKTGKPWIGMGRTVRSAHETCIVATRGRFKVANRSVRSVFEAKVPVDEHGKYIHSAKPAEFFELVHRLVGEQYPRMELFARQRRAGWAAIGDELPEQSP